MSAPLVRAIFVAGVVGLSALFVLTDGVPRRSAVVLASLLPAVILLIQLVRRRIIGPTPWWYVLGALVTLTAHNLQSLIQVGILGKATADGIGPLITLPVGYLLLLVAAGMVAFPFARQDIGGIIDGVIIALGCASILWATLIQPALTDQGSSAGGLTYELAILLILSTIAGAVVRALVVSPAARPVLAYLLMAILATLAGNVVGDITEDPVSGAQPWWIGLIWIVGYLALGVAALHPAHRHLGRPDVHRSVRLTGARLTYLGLVLALNPVLAAVTELRGGTVDWVLLASATVALVPLVIIRIGQLTRLHADAQEKLARLASRDELTGLPNRRTLSLRLTQVLDQVAEGTLPGAVLFFLDLNDFKDVNDSYGHSVGDRLLVAVAGRVAAVLRAGDLVARFGGDEFVVLCTGDPEAVDRRVRDAITRALADPVALDGVTLRCRASVGSAPVHSGQRVDGENLLSRADADMYRVKTAAKLVDPERDDPDPDVAGSPTLAT